jgi:uncharacterized protein
MDPMTGTSLDKTTSPLAPMAQSEEQNLAALAHLSVLLNLVTGFLGILGALVIYVIYKDRSRYISFHALQSVLFQLGGLIIPGVIVFALWAASISTVIFFGFGLLLMPVAILATCLLALVVPGMAIYSIVGAVQCWSGRDFRYWLAGDWTDKLLKGGKGNVDQQTVGGSSGT